MTARRGAKNHPHPALPGVNLLSASAFALLAARKLRRRFLAAGIGLVVLVAGLGTLQHLRVAEAERLVAAEQAETTRLQTESQALAPVRAFIDGVARQEQTVKSNMAGEVYTSTVLEALYFATPSGLRIEAVSLAVAAAQPADGAAAPEVLSPCPGPDPFNTRAVIGCITLSGTADSRVEVGEFVIKLGERGLFVEPFISTTTTADTTGVSFSGSVGLSREAYSERFGVPAKTVAQGVAQ